MNLYSAFHTSPKALRYLLCVTRASHSFTCHSHTNHTCLYSPATRHHRLWLVLIAPTHEGVIRLSWPGWQATYRDKCPAPGTEPGHGHQSQYYPAYLADNCHLLSDAGRRPLRSHSNDIRKLLVPRTHNKLDDRSFSAAGPRLWNDLPPRLRQPGLSFDSFRRSLKTHLFGDWSA